MVLKILQLTDKSLHTIKNDFLIFLNIKNSVYYCLDLRKVSETKNKKSIILKVYSTINSNIIRTEIRFIYNLQQQK